jgi:ubiquinone/menaquinone biosynthesis C-methylase UbiE
MTAHRPDETARSYDTLAEQYAKKMLRELDAKPFDREALDRFSRSARPDGEIADLGCGPGQIGRYLADKGCQVVGLDISPAMIELARRSHPGIRFEHGDMLALPFRDASLAGIVAFYSIIHLPLETISAALLEMRRVLKPEGQLLLAFHIGANTLHLDTLWDFGIDIDFHFFMPGDVAARVRGAGMEVLEVLERDPYPDPIEAQTRRCYLLAQRRDGP